MRKIACLLRWLLCLLAALPALACAEVMPEAVSAAFAADARWAGYAPVASTPYGTDEGGHAWQIAVVMQRDEHNVLCMLEREGEGNGYTLTIANENAVLQGNALPRLLIDTGGDALFYTYAFEEGEVAVARYITMKEGEGWGPVGIEVFAQPNADQSVYEWYIHADEGGLAYSYRLSDENGNLLRDDGVASVPAAVDTTLAAFDIRLVPLTLAQAQAMYTP